MNRVNVPKLRFPGFEGEWEEKKLQEVSSFLDGRRKPIKSGDRSKMKGEYPYYGASGIIDYVNNYIFDEELILLGEDGENIISRNSPLAFRVSGKCWINNHAHVIVPKDNTNIDFLTHNLERINYVVYNTGTAQPKLNQEVCRNIPSWFPSLPEQQKIASFLSAVDEKIQQLSRKKELLEQYKKGVMQQLFSGKLRFKDENGNEYPDWEEKSFGDIFTFYTTNSLSREKLNYEEGKVKNIHYGDIHTKFKTLFDINNEIVPFINLDFDFSKIKKECYCQEGDLVIADASEDYADIGKSIEIINLKNEKVLAGLHTFLARPNKTRMYIGFSGYIVRSDNFRKQIMTIAQGSKVLSISTGRLAMLEMKIPIIEEQQKIANFLSSIDAKIENTHGELEKIQLFKKGLLQKMFV